jgi:hypothetical protein
MLFIPIEMGPRDVYHSPSASDPSLETAPSLFVFAQTKARSNLIAATLLDHQSSKYDILIQPGLGIDQGS